MTVPAPESDWHASPPVATGPAAGSDPPRAAPATGVADGRAEQPRSQALQALQARLASQLEAQADERGRSWLAVECAGTGVLLPLAQAGEIVPYRGSVAVPHTRPWFLGVANLRGALHGVVDLGRFLGLASDAAAQGEGWVVALNPRLEIPTALRVDRLAGLRREAQLEPLDAGVSPGGRPRFAAARFGEPGSTRRWQEIDLVELAADPHFLAIAAVP